MIGMALIRHLTQQGIDVTVIIRPDSRRKGRIEGTGAHIVEGGLSDLTACRQEMPGNYDYFFHFAWAGTFGAARDDMNLQTDNIKGTLAAVELARLLGCEAFIGAGSQAEYGRVSGKLTPETKVAPETGYGMAKLCAGLMSRKTCAAYGIRHIWVRILSVYGPYDGKDTMVMSSIRNMLAGRASDYTKGEQIWDYLYSRDAADALLRLAQSGKAGKTYCLGSAQARPLADYIRDIRDVVNPKAEIRLGAVPYSENQVMVLCADIEDLQTDVGFYPVTSFADGIKETLDWVEGEMDK